VMKAPNITNGLHYQRNVKDVSSALKHVYKVRKVMYDSKTCYAVPYIMLQVRIVDNKEVKLIFLGGEFHHIMSCSMSNVVTRLHGFCDNDLISFATAAIRHLSEHSEYILDGLVRVDIFKNNEGNLVVNEFESLEARYFTGNASVHGNCCTFLEKYWKKKIYQSIIFLLN